MTKAYFLTYIVLFVNASQIFLQESTFLKIHKKQFESEVLGSIQGLVFDLEDHHPIANANVYIEGTDWGTVTDSSGAYKIGFILSGNYNVIAGTIGYHRTKVIGIKVIKEYNAIVNFPLINIMIPEDPMPIEWSNKYKK